MPSIFIFAKSQALPRGAVHLEKISLDATLVVLVQMAHAYGSLLDSVHFGHVC
jgi:hypothetical protein